MSHLDIHCSLSYNFLFIWSCSPRVHHSSVVGHLIEGVSNGLCENLRACEQCVYFCELEQLSNFSCEQRALEKNTDGEQRVLRQVIANNLADTSKTQQQLQAELLKKD